MLSDVPHKPCIILVRPQMGENIGAAARAMLNFGLSDLRLVAPRDGWPNQAAIDNAAGAFDIIPDPQLYDSLQCALHDCHYSYATTARLRDMNVRQHDLPDAADEAMKHIQTGARVALVFGPERTGLENAELNLCSHYVTISTNPDFPSLNLSQAVLLVCYALGQTQRISESKPSIDPAADHSAFDGFFTRLTSALEDGRFFREKNMKPTMVQNIRAMLKRADLSDQEIKTFHGILSALIGKKANKKAADK